MRSLIYLFALLQGGGGLSLLSFVWWAGGGYCGTPYPGGWRGPTPPGDPWLVYKVIGVVVGIGGGWAFNQSFGPQPEPWMPALSVLGAFITARVVGDLVAVARGANRAA